MKSIFKEYKSLRVLYNITSTNFRHTLCPSQQVEVNKSERMGKEVIPQVRKKRKSQLFIVDKTLSTSHYLSHPPKYFKWQLKNILQTLAVKEQSWLRGQPPSFVHLVTSLQHWGHQASSIHHAKTRWLWPERLMGSPHFAWGKGMYCTPHCWALLW